MPEKKADFSRRDFLKTAGAVGLGSMIAPIDNLTHSKRLYAANLSQKDTVPKRPFGKTGENISILGIGLASAKSSQLLFKQAVNMGVTYWDTAPIYAGGRSEVAIGKYFQKYQEDRKKVFLATKSISSSPKRIAKSLDESLERMKTNYIDLYFVHGVDNVESQVDQDVKSWAEGAKAEGKIRFFGFSTHRNMIKCLNEAAKLDWIDAIMLTYNYRLMHTSEMKSAVKACVNSGIGLTAMKTQARSSSFGSVGKETSNSKELIERFSRKGFTAEQAKLKAVWDSPYISSICSHMTNMTVLQANVAAALSKTKLSFQDQHLLEQYGWETASRYCAGCAHICEPAINNQVPISDVMRYLMYARCYGEPDRAKSAFKRMPSKVRKILVDMDYKKAERKCPQRMQIGRLMREAASELV